MRRISEVDQMQGLEQEHVMHRNGSGMDEEQEDGGGSEGMEGDGPLDHGNFSDQQGGAVGRGSGSGSSENQLTLSFQGEVYVFDSVSPEKVQAVLLLLGGREVPASLPAIPMVSQNNNRRLASLMRFREKRKDRNFDKKIRYSVRKEVALRMQRHKGQFTSSKPRDGSTPGSNYDASRWGSDANGSQESVCRHCGTGQNSTPMMRRGPDGPRTLCNACGLMWANKGTLRDLSKATAIIIDNTPAANVNEEHRAVLAIEAGSAANFNDSS